MNSPIFQFFCSTFLSFLSLALLLPHLRTKLLDNPNQRSSHLIATPRGGGLSFVIVGTILNYVYSNSSIRFVPILCLPLAFVGLVDDYKDLPASWRYIIQLMTATILVLLARIEMHIWQVPIYILLVSALINFINFMDGLDGIVAGCSVLLFAASSHWSLAGAIMGFLIWNWSPAKVFMGDVGSTYIGAVFSGLAFQEPTAYSMLSVLLLGFPLFADASACVIRRLLHQQNIFEAHKQHLYQRLNQAGWSHSQVASLYIISVALLIMANSLWGLPSLMMMIIIELLVAFFLDQNIATKFEEF